MQLKYPNHSVPSPCSCHRSTAERWRVAVSADGVNGQPIRLRYSFAILWLMDLGLALAVFICETGAPEKDFFGSFLFSPVMRGVWRLFVRRCAFQSDNLNLISSADWRPADRYSEPTFVLLRRV